jgi:predicted membrane chloride channel (bestrophin family)
MRVFTMDRRMALAVIKLVRLSRERASKAGEMRSFNVESVSRKLADIDAQIAACEQEILAGGLDEHK